MAVEIGTFDNINVTDLAEVRRWIRSWLPRSDEQFVTDAVVVANELVTNALQHTTTSCAIRLTWHERQLRIDVDDDSPVQARPRTPDVHGGRGLHLVAALAHSWGQHLHPWGKTVWALLTAPAPRETGCQVPNPRRPT
ncbi:ATP-binding protein [Amycolatopsis sp. YIM 10]|uniref:ATP-binding protein n=1 Tax=Amycolatopsis sp. YIM 10 TaxID=2653857 RepID=UPI001D14AE8D|nr:ATP-binding protein [Amycolatopsis sp. YIM 10]